MTDDNRIPTETVMSDWAADNRILDADTVRRIWPRDDNDVDTATVPHLVMLCASHEALRAALDARVECWSCPECAFTFDAFHSDVDGGYSCPACAETRLRAALATAKAHAKSLRLSLDEAKRIARQREQRAEVAEAALVIAEAERDTWKAYAARVAQEARDNFGVAEAAEERVGVLEAALRGLVDGYGRDHGPEWYPKLRAARALLLGESDTTHAT